MKKRNVRNIKQYIVGIVFCLFIGIMCILLLFLPKKTYSTNEKRYLESFPKVSVETVFNGSFGTDYETYISDHIAGRDFFVGMNAYYNLYSGRNGANGVYAGKDDYLINVPVDDDSKLINNVTLLAEFAKKNKIDASLMVVPSTGFVLKDKLPSVHYAYNDAAMFDEIAKNKGSLQFIDLQQSFLKAAQNGTQLYYKTDHHWTAAGAYTAYIDYCKALNLTPTNMGNFTIAKYPDFYGTAYSTSALWFYPPDSIELWKNKNHTENSIQVEIIEGTKTETFNSLFFTKHLQEDDKYPVFLDGNHSLVKISNSKAPGGKLLLIKDSFSHSLAPFLADNYSEIVMVDLRYYKDPVSDLIKTENFEDVLMVYGIDQICTDTNLNFLA